MTNTLKLVWASIFMVIVYILIAVAVKFYVDWIFDKKVIWIILITLLVLTIPRLILNYIPILIGSTSNNQASLLKVASALSWVARTLYLLFVITFLDIHSTPSIVLCVFCYLLFLALANFFAHGIVKHVLVSGNNII